MDKPKCYDPIPSFNQETEYVIEGSPVDMGDHLQIPLIVKPIENEEAPHE